MPKPTGHRIRRVGAVSDRILGQGLRARGTSMTGLIVSLTSHYSRIHFLEGVLRELSHQTLAPTLVVINLPRTLPPIELDGVALPFALEINMVDDVGPASKLLPTLSRYESSPIVTIDDDVIYRPTLLQELVETSERFPGARVAGQARRVPNQFLTSLVPYLLWPKVRSSQPMPAKYSVALGCEGVLYPPNSLLPGVHDEDSLLSLAKYQDDLWFWAHGELSESELVVLGFGVDSPRRVGSDLSGRWRSNRVQNNVALTLLFDRFPALAEGGPSSGTFLLRAAAYLLFLVTRKIRS